MHLSTVFSALTILSSLSLISADHNPPHRRHLVRTPRLEKRYDPIIVGRADDSSVNATVGSTSIDSTITQISTTSSPSSTTTSTNTEATSSAAEASGKYGDTVTPVSSSSTSSTTSTETATSEVVTTSSTIDSAVETSSSVTDQFTAAESSGTYHSTVNPVVSSTTSSSSSQATSTVATRSDNKVTVVTATITSSSSASAGAANSQKDETTGGLSKTALIVIIVLSSVVGIAALAVFAIRKWKLRPSNRFDERMKPIDFSPSGNDGMDDVLTMSNDMADQQRRQFVKELEAEPDYVAGIPEHDFTAGAGHQGNYPGMEYDNGMYNSDPFAHAQAFEYDDSNYYSDPSQQPLSTVHYPPPSAGHVNFPNHPVQDYPTQDDGYADLQRGNSNGSDHRRPERLSGSGSGSGHGHAYDNGHGTQGQVYPDEFPSAESYLGRPTGGTDGPYAQAAQYRY